MKALAAQTRAELVLTLRRGESVLLTLVIPILLLVFFSSVDILPVGVKDPVDFLAPGILALAVMSTAMVGLGIATGFERQYGVLKRLGSTPLGRPRLLGAKTNSIIAVIFFRWYYAEERTSGEVLYWEDVERELKQLGPS